MPANFAHIWAAIKDKKDKKRGKNNSPLMTCASKVQNLSKKQEQRKK
jgi:hypothetical protein